VGRRRPGSHPPAARLHPADAAQDAPGSPSFGPFGEGRREWDLVVEDFTLPEPKTRLMAKALSNLVGEASVLILIPDKNGSYDLVTRSANNLPDTTLLMASYLNIRDLLRHDKIILPLQALDVIKSYLE
jgi:ribosomal protein L4